MEKLTEEQIAALSPEEQLAYYKNLHAAAAQQLSDTQTQLSDVQINLAATEAQSAEEIGKLSQQLAQASKSAALGYRVVEIGSTQYRVVGKQFNIPGKGIVTAADLVKDNEQLEKLIASNSGILVAIED